MSAWLVSEEARKRMLDTLVLQLQVTVSHWIWVLGIKLRPAVRAVPSINP